MFRSVPYSEVFHARSCFILGVVLPYEISYSLLESQALHTNVFCRDWLQLRGFSLTCKYSDLAVCRAALAEALDDFEKKSSSFYLFIPFGYLRVSKIPFVDTGPLVEICSRHVRLLTVPSATLTSATPEVIAGFRGLVSLSSLDKLDL